MRAFCEPVHPSGPEPTFQSILSSRNEGLEWAASWLLRSSRHRQADRDNPRPISARRTITRHSVARDTVERRCRTADCVHRDAYAEFAGVSCGNCGRRSNRVLVLRNPVQGVRARDCVWATGWSTPAGDESEKSRGPYKLCVCGARSHCRPAPRPVLVDEHAAALSRTQRCRRLNHSASRRSRRMRTFLRARANCVAVGRALRAPRGRRAPFPDLPALRRAGTAWDRALMERG